MAEVRNPTEPSMEEILASIRRIIVDEEPAGAAAPAPARTVPSRLPPLGPIGANSASRVATTDASPRQFPAPPPNAAPVNRPPPVQAAILDLTDRIDDDPPPHEDEPPLPPLQAPPSSANRLHRPPPLKPASSDPPSRPISDDGLAASVAALTKIATMSQAARQPELPLGEVGRTLEDMVRELLRPHMKEWLDANLPRLVERIVREEIGRLVRAAQER